LLESLIVVTILALVIAIALPAMRRPLSRRNLRSAATQVCDALARARLDAIESGVSRQFRFQPAAGRYEIAPRLMSDQGMNLPFSTGGVGRSPLAAESRGQRDPVQFDLPEGVCFCGIATTEPAPDDAILSTTVDVAQWSAPIVFYSSGKASNARIRLQGADGLYIDVTLRGLTGSTKIGPLLHEEPLE